MKRNIFITSIFILAVLLAGVNVAFAHCDTMDGPVVKAARDYVGHYIKYVHFVERLYEAAAESAEGHY